MRCLDNITDSMGMNLSKFWKTRTRKPAVLKSMGSKRVGHDLATEHTHTKLLGHRFYIYIYTYIGIYIYAYAYKFTSV